jgi:AraC-like DNA-binding protein
MLKQDVSVSNAWVQNLINYVTNYKVRVDEVWNLCGLNSNKLDGGGRLSMDETVKIWEACVHLSRDEWFGLHLGQNIKPTAFQIVGYTLMNSQNLSSALIKLTEYQRLVSDGGSFQQLPAQEGVWLIYHSNPQTLPFIYHQIDAVLTSLITFSEWVIHDRISPLKVCLKRKAPQNTEVYLDAFGILPDFEQPFDGFLVSKTLLETPILGADPNLGRLHEMYAKQQLEDLSAEEPMITKIEKLVRFELSNPDLCRGMIAEKLGWSEKKLQRYLSGEGKKFHGILDDVRKLVSLEYLADTRLPMVEIAEMLGFSDISAFHRAFKRWNGITPGQYRKES